MRTQPGLECSYNNGFKITFDNGITVSVKWSESSYCARHEPAIGWFRDSKSIRRDLRNTKTWSPNAEVLISNEGELMSWGIDEVRGFVTPDQLALIIGAAQSARSFDLENITRLRELGLAADAKHGCLLESVRLKLINLGLAFEFDEGPIEEPVEAQINEFE